MPEVPSNPHLFAWIASVAAKLTPERVVWVDGSAEQQRAFSEQLVEQKIFTRLNEHEYPNSFWCRSDPSDVARVEDRTFICSRSEADAGPTNHWRDPADMYTHLDRLMAGCMRGRTMYVIPYLMGPDGSPFSKVGFELTDSLYVVVNMAIMARTGEVALKNLPSESADFVRGVHSVGALDAENRFICHFPEDNTIISFNSNYGGNALQGKKCFALRIASTLGRRDGWLAEHMLILGITNPQGRKTYLCAAFPSACGKTNLAMMVPSQSYLAQGWKVETVGDDIAWLNFGADGRLYAINPEDGFFGVAPGTSMKTNPNAMASIRSNTIFTNTALDLDTLTPWWEGMGSAPARAIDWLGREWSPTYKTKAAHPNSRFTAPARQCPSIDPARESPEGVPISAIVFGGRRAKTAPLVYQARSWQHGTFIGATMASETTAAAVGDVGQLRRDPMAMLPFIGYHVGDYFQHWLDMGARAGAQMPDVFHINWFRTGSKGEFLWPGFGENIRVLEWIVERVHGDVSADESPLGYQPRAADINLEGLGLSAESVQALFAVVPEEWRDELRSQRDFFASIGSRIPQPLLDEHHALARRLGLAS